jgi:hypothetical protein
MLGGTSAEHPAVAAASLLFFSIAVLHEARKESTASGFFRFGNTGVGRTADPWGTIVLNRPVTAKEMTAMGFVVRASYKDNCRQKDSKNNQFFGG